MDKVYPKHLYEPIRIKIATDYIKQELRKLLPNIHGDKIWEEMDINIDNWFKKNPDVKGPRNFWNGFHGMATGFKLKIGLLQILTAENIVWKFEKKLPLDNKLTSGGNLKYIDKRLLERRPTASHLRDFFSKEKEIAEKWKENFHEHGATSESRDHFPVIGMEEVDNNEQIISIHDGNRRMILAILEKKETISAYIGSYVTKNKVPKNFWLPTSFLQEVVYEGELANSYENTLKMLGQLTKLSDSGSYELYKRVLIGNNKFRMKLKRDLLS